jgi:hypothetical protein
MERFYEPSQEPVSADLDGRGYRPRQSVGRESGWRWGAYDRE